MNKNSSAILTLCSRLCVGKDVEPLEPREWNMLAGKLVELKLQPSDLLDFSDGDFTARLDIDSDFADRLKRLIDRSASLTVELSEYENIGIRAVTRSDPEYPATLKKRLKKACPPIFYCSGDTSLLKKEYIGYAGSRAVSEEDVEFTEKAVLKTVRAGYGAVTGGARGVDSAATEAALNAGAEAVEFVSDSLMKKLRKSATVKAVSDGRLLILSAVNPNAGFTVGSAMTRNKYVYAQSSATVIIRSDLNKGGTWAGAVENLKNQWCRELCRCKKNYPGNMELIKMGAIPIDDSWDGKIEGLPLSSAAESGECEQLTFYG